MTFFGNIEGLTIWTTSWDDLVEHISTAHIHAKTTITIDRGLDERGQFRHIRLDGQARDVLTLLRLMREEGMVTA